MSSPITKLAQLPFAAIRAIDPAVDFLGRLPEVERAFTDRSTEAQDALDTLLERVGSARDELADLRESADSLGGRLESAKQEIAALNQTATELTTTMAQLEGSLEHVLGRVPGLSAERAGELGEEVQKRAKRKAA